MSRASGSHTGKGIHTMIVDDNVGLAENIAEILEFEGFTAVVAASAEEALVLAQALVVDILITDFRLPGMSGADLVRTLRRDCVDLRALVISAHNDDETIGDARDAGAEFLAKPVDFSALNRFVRRP